MQHVSTVTASPHFEFMDNYLHAFIASLSVIIVSEIGDKTFFIAAILAMRHSRIVVFTGAISALGLMTVFSGKLCSKHCLLLLPDQIVNRIHRD